jgi:RNA polymerase sigma-70 factor (ECF subfamily)
MTMKLEASTKWKHFEDEDAFPISESKKNPEAFSALYDRYVQPIYRYLYHRIGNISEAEDLTSQTFLSALEALPRYRHQGNFAAWLFRIARGKVIDHVRKRQRQVPLDDTYPAETTDLLANALHSDEIDALRALIHELTEDEQELIRLRYTVGLPFAQIAVILDSNENTVKKSLYRIIARLQGELEGYYHE